MAYTRQEQETSIVWDDEGKVARIYAASPVTMRKLDKLCAEFPTEYRRVWTETDKHGNVTAARYETACKRIRFAKPASEAQKERGRAVAAILQERRKEAEQ